VFSFTHSERQVIHMNEWEKDEMGYWERKYSLTNPIFPPSYRLFEREKFLFRWLRSTIGGKTLIEIGCCFPNEIILVLNPSKYKYDYVGVDVVRGALKIAKKHVPEGMFVRCSATSLPFRNETFDIILSLGVLHHLHGGTENIGKLSRFLRRKGLFALAEVIERKTLTRTFDKLTRESSSPHEGRLNREKLIRASIESGKILHFNENNSVVLGLSLVPIGFFPILQESKNYLRFITAIDQFAIKAFGRVLSLFDAGTYFLIWKKN